MNLHQALDLIRIRAGWGDADVEDAGICKLVILYIGAKELSASAYPELRTLMAQWPESSGDYVYPVPGFGEGIEAAFNRATRSRTLWAQNTAYGRARWRLLLWLIKQTEGDGDV